MKVEFTSNQLKLLRDHFDALEQDRQVREARMSQMLHKLIAQSHSTEQKLADVLAEIGILDSRISKAERKGATEKQALEAALALESQNIIPTVTHMSKQLQGDMADALRKINDLRVELISQLEYKKRFLEVIEKVDAFDARLSEAMKRSRLDQAALTAATAVEAQNIIPTVKAMIDDLKAHGDMTVKRIHEAKVAHSKELDDKHKAMVEAMKASVKDSLTGQQSQIVKAIHDALSTHIQ